MGNTNADGIWAPDEDDTMEADVWASMMRDSITGGLGKRMKLQETRVSLRATTPVPFDVDSPDPTTPYTVIPLTVGQYTGNRAPEPDFSGGNHAEGIEIEGNYAKILTPGMYSILGQVTILPGAAPHAWDFFGSISSSGIFGLPDYGLTSNESFVSGRVSDTRILAAGDMISLTIGVGTDHIGSLRVQDALLTVTMHYALPSEAIPGL